MGIIGAIFILLMIDLVCVLIKMSFKKLDEVFSGTSNTGSSTNEPVTWEAMGRAKCQCLACNEMVYIPTQYLSDNLCCFRINIHKLYILAKVH